MKKSATLILILLLTAILAFTLVACNKNSDVESNSIIATFVLDSNDDIEDFSMRRGIVFNHKIEELRKINNVEAHWSSSNKDDNATITVKNVTQKNLSAVLAAIGSEPILSFKDKNDTTANALFYGDGNIEGASISVEGPSNSSIIIKLTENGIQNFNDNYSKMLYFFLDDICITQAKVSTLNHASSMIITTSNGFEPLAARELVAKINASVFGVKIKNMTIEYAG